MHKKAALKYDRWGIEVYNRRIGIKDTQEIGNNKSDLIEKKYPHLGIRLWNTGKNQDCGSFISR